jgi:hypothetical protein
MPPKSPKSSDSLEVNSNEKLNKLVDMVNDLKNSQNKIVVSLNSCREAIKAQDKKYVSFESKLDLLSTQLLEVLNENKTLKEKVDQLEVKLLDMERPQNNESLCNMAQEKVYSELLDRQSRARNIILFNVPESFNLPDHTQDTSITQDIFSTIGIPTNPISIHRLGKVSNKPRPLRIVLPTPADVFEVLKAKRKLLGVNNLNSIRISTDQTLQQRKYFSSIMTELKSRRDSGENDLFIKYFNGLPTISKND